jgi:hypothetical protein
MPSRMKRPETEEKVVGRAGTAGWTVVVAGVVAGLGLADAPSAAFCAISASMSWSEGIITGGEGAVTGLAAVTGKGRESVAGAGAAAWDGGGAAAEVGFVAAAATACSRSRFLLSGSWTLYTSPKKTPPRDIDKKAMSVTKREGSKVVLADRLHAEAAAKMRPSARSMILAV